jgi:hypothetical protein
MNSTVDNSMTPEQSFQVITEMISKAKANYNNTISFYLLLWGIILVISPWLDHGLKLLGVEYHYLVWLVLSTAGVAIGIFHGIRLGKREITYSVLDKVILAIWISCSVSFFIMFILQFAGYLRGPEFSLISGIGCFASGWILKFKPLQIGGIAFWLITPIFYMFPEYWKELMTMGILIGYVFPGIALRNHLKNV